MVYRILIFSFLFLRGLTLFSQTDWKGEIGEIHPAMPKTKLQEASWSYFEVLENAKVGDEVVGRVGLANNSFENTEFELIGGSGAANFSITKFVNSRGKNFGIIKVKSLPLTGASYTLKVKARFNNGITDEQEYTVKKVSQTIAESFYQFVYARLSRNGDMTTSVADGTLSGFLAKMQNNGSFSDLPFGLTKAGWEGLCEAAERLNGIAMAYLNPKSVYYNDEGIKQKIYTALIFHSTEFAKYRTQWYETHLWRQSDYIGGIGINFYTRLRSEMNSADPAVSSRALAVYDAIIDNCDIMFAERMNERPAIANSNRNHRMRCLAVRAAMSYDYNRALTDWDLWYDSVDPRIPGYYPTGAINDLMEIEETSFYKTFTYNNRNGFFPDGTICHHPAVGVQFTANDYSWGWLTEWSIPLANQLKNTIYQAHDATYDIVADGLLDSYRPLTFEGYLDMSVGGFIPDLSKWGKNLSTAVSSLLSGKSTNTTIKREAELRSYLAKLTAPNYSDPLSMNQPFWNLEYMMQRRPDYFVSAKIMSKRSRGLERGIENRSYYYLGDGALFVRVNPSDYNAIQNHYDWHAIPGTTTEQRGITVLPSDAQSGYTGANGTNTYAGVASNGSVGMCAFKYERNHTRPGDIYATVNANKGYFFFEKEFVALGNKVRRVIPGNEREIWTTLNQIEWKGDVSYGIVSSGTTQVLAFNGGNSRNDLNNVRGPVWFYHDKVGYVVVPVNNQSVNIKLIAESRDYQFPFKANSQKKIFELAINHGVNPSGDSYQYILLPATTLAQVKQFAESVGQSDSRLQILRNDEQVMAVYDRELDLVEVAFFEPTTLEYSGKTGEKLRLSVDRQALVMVKKTASQLEYVVTDPNYSTDDAVINVTTNARIKGLAYDPLAQETRIPFGHSTQEVFAGKPVVRTFEADNDISGIPDPSETNPAPQIVFDSLNKEIRLSLSSENKELLVQLCNLSGQMLWQKKVSIPADCSLVKIPATNLKSGVFLIKVTGNATTCCSKILINNP